MSAVGWMRLLEFTVDFLRFDEDQVDRANKLLDSYRVRADAIRITIRIIRK